MFKLRAVGEQRVCTRQCRQVSVGSVLLIFCSFTRSRVVSAIGRDPRRDELTVWGHARRPRERVSKLFVCVASCNYRSVAPLILDLDPRPACWSPVLTPCPSCRFTSATHRPCCVSRHFQGCSPSGPWIYPICTPCLPRPARPLLCY